MTTPSETLPSWSTDPRRRNPSVDRRRATTGLSGQLRFLAADDGAACTWSTLLVEGPTEAPGRHERVWFQWVATVSAKP